MEYIQQFIQYLSNQHKGISRNTLKNYKADISRFVLWVEKEFGIRFEPARITGHMITLYKKSSLGKPLIQQENLSELSNRSFSRHLSSLRSFFRFLKTTSLITDDPFDAFHSLEKPKKSQPSYLQGFKNFLYVYNASDLTIKNYLIDVKQFLHWVHEVSGIEHSFELKEKDIFRKISQQTVTEYKNRLLEQSRLSPISVNRKLSSLRKFFRWAITQGLMEEKQLSSQKTVHPDFFPKPQPVSSVEKQQHGLPQQPNTALYSSFPPLRLLQKISTLLNKVIDTTMITPLIVLIEQTSLFTWKVKGKPIFTGKSLFKSAQSREQVFHATQVVPSIKKEFYAPLSMSTKNFPAHKKMWFFIRHKRPEWYKKYHQYSFVHYFHFAILVILMSAIGFAFYRSFFISPSQKNPVFAQTAPPRLLSFQGRLTDASDNPITSTKQIKFAIYTSATNDGTAALWQETDTITPDKDGIFSVVLGATTALPQSLFANNSALWLGITIDSDPELVPRQQLASVAYATNSELLQGMPPITQTGAGTKNVILALDSSGNLTIGETASPTFQATGGKLTLTGQGLLLTTNVGSGNNVTIAPNGTGIIDLQKPIQNSTDSNNPSGVTGAVEIDDLLAVLATSSAQAILNINQTSTGNLISASQNGTARFIIKNKGGAFFEGDVGLNVQSPAARLDVSGSATISGNLTFYGTTTVIQTIANSTLTVGGSSTGNIILSPLNGISGSYIAPNTNNQVDLGTSSAAFRNIYVNNVIGASVGTQGYLQRNSGALSPSNITDDFLLGTTATSSARIGFINIAGGSPTATMSGNFAHVVPTGNASSATFDILNNGTLNFRRSPGGDAGLTTALFIQNTGNIGIGTTAPSAVLTVNGTLTQSGGTANINASGTSATNIGNSTGALTLASGGTSGWTNTAGNLTISTATSGNLNLQAVSTLALSTTASNSSITIAPNGTGSIQLTSGVTTGTGTSSGFSLTSSTLQNGHVAEIASTSTAGTASDNAYLLYLTSSGANANTAHTQYGLYSTVTNTNATSGTNIAAYLSASGATTANYGLIVANGSVGIGNTTPLTALDVTGSASVSANLSYRGQATSHTFNILDNGTLNIQRSPGGDAGLATALFIQNNGNIGIGTTAPDQLLTIAPGGNSTPVLGLKSSGGAGAEIFMGTSGSYDTAITSSVTIASALDFRTGGTAAGNIRMLINSTGNVGIGNTVPLTALDVTGSASVSANLSYRGAATAHTFNILDNGTLNLQRSPSGDAGVTSVMFIQNNGNIGLGNTTPLTTLDVTGSASVSANLSLRGAATAHTFNILDNGTLNFQTSPSGDAGVATALFMNNNGSIGIGTTTTTTGKLAISASSARTGSDYIITDITGTQTTANTGAFYGINLTPKYSAASGNTLDTSYAIVSNPQNTGTGTITHSYGLYSRVDNSSTGTISNAYGVRVAIPNNSGTITTNYGEYIENMGLSGTTTSYGIFLASQTGSATNYAIYATGGTSYFGGNVGIGNTNPLTALDVTGSASVSANLSLRGQATAHTFNILDNGTLNIQRSPSGDAGVASVMFFQNNGNIGINTNAPAFRLDVRDSQAATVAAQISNTNTGTDADGLIVKLGNTNTTVAATNHFVSFETAGIGVVGSIQGNGSTGVSYVQNGIADFAEYLKKDPNDTIEYGSVLCIDQTENVFACTSENQQIIGVASEHPAFLGGQNLGNGSIAVGLVGLVTTTVSSQNGPIVAGDNLTASPLSGVAVKALNAGQIVGKAMTSYTGKEVGKILVAVSPSWYDPNAYLTNAGDLTITKTYNNDINNNQIISYNITDTVTGRVITQIGAFAQTLTGQLQAGLVVAQHVTADSLAITTSNITVGKTLLKDYITQIVQETLANTGLSPIPILSPIAAIDQIHTNVISPLSSNTIVVQLPDSGKFEIKNASGSAVASIDATGKLAAQSASISGQLAANQGQFTNASVSGTLSAGRIVADEIGGLNEKLATLAAALNQPTSNQTTPSATPTSIPNLLSQSNNATSSASILNTIYSIPNTNSIDIASFSAQLIAVRDLSAETATVTQGLMAFGPSSLSDVAVTGQLSIGASFILTDNSINTLGADLQLQPLKQAGLSLMGDLIHVDTSGNVRFGGNADFDKDVTIHGTLAANIISPLADNDFTVQLNTTKSHQSTSFVVKDSSASAVFSVDQKGNLSASGSASFTDILARTFTIVRSVQADTSLTETIATASAGTATIIQGETERTILTPYVTDKSLIYLTPTTDTKGVTPYIARQTAQDSEKKIRGSFTIQIPHAIYSDMNLNWWIVN